MGMYATLLDASVSCPNCGACCTGAWQFYFGDVSSLPIYRMGEHVRWGGRVSFGAPSMTLIRALAYCASAPACAACKADSLIAEVLIEDGVIREIAIPIARAHIEELLYEGEDRIPRFAKDLR